MTQTPPITTLKQLIAYCMAQDVLYRTGKISFATGQTKVAAAIADYKNPPAL
jgi:hypothetical protein